MIVATYYNEIDPYAVQWLHNLIARRLIPPGDVDARSIESVAPDDVRGYRQAHFFAGIGGWPLALALAGWPDDRPVWTGSCPCQPFSVAGKQRGVHDERDLWPTWLNLIRQCRPAICFGEQVASAIAHGWLDRSFNDLEEEGYACAASVLPACSVGAPHRRDRLWFVADASAGWRPNNKLRAGGREPWICNKNDVADAQHGGRDARLPRDERGEEGTGRTHGAIADRRGCDVEHAARVGRREGRPESEFRGGRTTPASAGIPDALADAAEQRSPEHPGQPGDARQQRAPAARGGWTVAGSVGRAEEQRSSPRPPHQPGENQQAGQPERSSAWSGAVWLEGADGKARRVGTRIRQLAARVPGELAGLCAGQEGAAPLQEEAREVIPLLEAGVQARVAKLRALGNAIVPQVAAAFIQAYLEARP